jgi:hypothetical protein
MGDLLIVPIPIWRRVRLGCWCEKREETLRLASPQYFISE